MRLCRLCGLFAAITLTLSSCTFVQEDVSHPEESAVSVSTRTTSTTTPAAVDAGNKPVSGRFLVAVSQATDGVTVGRGIEALLNAYFTHRCHSFARAEEVDLEAPAGLSVSEELKATESARVEGLRRLKALWNCRFSGATVRYTVEKTNTEGDTAVLCVYEAACFYNWYEEHTAPETSDLSGYGIRHVLRIRDGVIQSDHYNEGRPTGVATEGRLSDPVYLNYAGKEGSPTDFTGSPVVTVSPGSAAYPALYEPAKALAYAETWTLARNSRAFVDLHVWGGDCTNFVSQCLQSGGLPTQGNWYWNGGNTGEGGRAWKAATWLYVHLTEEFPTGRAMAMIEGIDPTGRTARYDGAAVEAKRLFFAGSPVFYRWKGGFAKDGEWSHVALCVGTLGDGTPAVSCHTEDRYNFKWNYGGEECEYGTVQLTAN